MADYNLGRAYGRIEIEFDDSGFRRAEQGFDRVGRQARGHNATMAGVAAGMGKAGLGIAAGLGLAVNSAANFEERLSAIKAVSGATTSQMEAIRTKALQLGKDTKYSATEAALAMEELVKAGVSVEDTVNGAADAAVALAAAGGVELPAAAELAANAMNAFSLSAQDMPKVADIIAGAANASAIDVGEFGFALKQVGAVANLAGISFKDTATAIALLGNAGIKGSDAGTSLKTMLSNLIPTTNKQKELFKELGILTKEGGNAFFDASGKAKSLAQISGILQKALKGMTKEQQMATLETMFGSDAIRAAAILSKEGAAGFSKMAKEMSKVKAADVAKERMNNLKGSMEELKGSMETIAIQLGTVLLPALKQIADGVTKLLGKFLELPESAQKIIVWAAASAAAFLLLGAAFIKIVMFATRLAAAIKVFMGLRFVMMIVLNLKGVIWILIGALKALSVALLTTPVGWIILAVVALVAVFVLLWKKCEGFRNFWKALWSGIVSVFKKVVEYLTPAFNALVTVAQFVFRMIAWYVTTYIKVVMTVIRAAMSVIVPIVSAAFGLIVSAVKLAMSVITAIIAVAWAIIKPIFKIAMTIISAYVRTYFNVIKVIVQTVMSVITKIIQIAWGIIGPIVRVAVQVMSKVISTAFNHIRAVTSTVWGVISAVISGVWEFIKRVVRTGVNMVVNYINGIKRVLDSVRKWFDGLKKAAEGGVGGLVRYVSSVPSKILGALGDMAGLLYNAGRQVIQGLINGISSMVGNLAGKLGEITNKIKDWKGPPAKDKILLVKNGRLIMEGLMAGIEDEIPTLEAMLGTITNVNITGAAAANRRAASTPPPVTNNNNRVEAPVTVVGANRDPRAVAIETSRTLAWQMGGI